MERLQKVPIYYRQPRVADGEIYFRRAGPAEWRGDVLANGTHVTVTYDSLGFRNPPDLVDWDIVVVGDSFVELGYLAWDDLYTTAIGDQLGLSVKNLGVSHVGPLTYSFYLSKYGKAPSTKEAVCVFFEGNDLDDLEREERDLARYRETGERPVRKIERTTSLVKAMSVLVNRTVNRVIRVDPAAIRETQTYNAFFVSAAKSVAIEVGPQRTYGPSADQIVALDRALARWAATSRSLGLRPWLAYMPSRRRVLNGHLRFEEGVSPDVRNYEPSTMPATVGALCGKNGIRFVDLAPRLRAAADGGVLPYNETDAHLNLAGCAVVAAALAEALETRP